MIGAWPAKRLDHHDTDSSNNRWVNLREATCSENSSNRGANSNNTSGHKGVCWHLYAGKWHVQIMHKGKRRSVGYFPEDKLDEAAAAYAAAAKELHGDFARTE
jgi:hypothetical protein